MPEEDMTEDEEEPEFNQSIQRNEKDSPSKVSARKDFIGFHKGDDKVDNLEGDTDASRDQDSFIYLRPEISIDPEFEQLQSIIGDDPRNWEMAVKS